MGGISLVLWLILYHSLGLLVILVDKMFSYCAPSSGEKWD
jgi:hypothetical protein